MATSAATSTATSTAGRKTHALRVGILGLALAGALLGTARPASADDYDPRRAGHPLRIIAYALHPIGVAFDYLLFRPAHWLGHREPIRTIFGHTGDEHRYHHTQPHAEP